MPSTQAELFPELAAIAPIPADPAWDEAFLRVESYLHAHHLESRVLLNRLTAEVIADAFDQRLAHPDVEPVVLAMQAVHLRIGAWFARAGNAGDWSDERVRMRGRLSLVLADLPGRCPNCFLSAGPVPTELAAALASGVLQPGPKLRFSNMPPAPLEFGFAEPGPLTIRQRNARLNPGLAVAWLGLVGLMVVAWSGTH